MADFFCCKMICLLPLSKKRWIFGNLNQFLTMKRIYPLSLALLLLTACGKDEKKVIDRDKTDWAFYKLEGDVKTITQKSFETLNGKEKGPTAHETISEHDIEFTFNDEGMLTVEKKWANDSKIFEETKYNGRNHLINKIQYNNGNPSIKTDYAYDEKSKNNLSITRRNADNTPFNKEVMKYKNNKVIEKIAYNEQQNPVSKTEYIYDERGNVTGENKYGSTDIIQYKIENIYNENNQKTLEKQFDKDGNKIYETQYSYAGDKLASAETHNAKGELTYVEKFDYDGKGNVIMHYTFDKFDGIHSREEYKYDGKGNKIAWYVYNGDDVVTKATYDYDKYGNLIKSLIADNNGNISENKVYQYEYDKKGNWIRRVLILNDKPSIITERTITYHK